MFGRENEVFVSIFKVDKVRNFLEVVTISSVDKEPLIVFFIIDYGIDHILL
jgi:hypothetical protein